MWKSRRFLTLSGVGAAGAFVAIVLSMSTANAAGSENGIAPGFGGGPYETCDGAVCLVMGPENFSDWQYGGVRPWWILRSVGAGVPLLGEPVFRWRVGHRDAAG